MSGLTRSEFEAVWEHFDREAQASKFSHQAVLWLADYYAGLDGEDKAVADAVLKEWILRDDEGRRFDALALIEDFEIRTALPALRELRARLEGATYPVQVDEREKADRIIKRLDPGDAWRPPSITPNAS